ncbi:MAG: hypothetical protein KME25_33680 [Symplocastrum torsivum CPER-KK1]|jgi:hypothetical protein|uniref:Uncharacterized protein n=1 Tax=Symplocastrum torsivum CPER-KK1 TaxID=450513 RepID=A0A951PV84_9CYAN|nr:hypothetical protein [Symplocastrum torsivum CPER-KK1]
MKENYLLTPILQGNLPKGQRSQQCLNPICKYLTQPRYPYKLNQKSLIKGLAAVNKWFDKFEENPLDTSRLGQLILLVLSHTVLLTDPEGYRLQISQGNLTLNCPLTWFYEGGNG